MLLFLFPGLPDDDMIEKGFVGLSKLSKNDSFVFKRRFTKTKS